MQRTRTPRWAALAQLASILILMILSFSGQSIFEANAQTPGAIPVNPGDNIQQLVNSNPEGTTFLLRPGYHRNQSIVPRTGNQFIGEPGAILSGAVSLTNFSREGNYWVSSGRTEQGNRAGFCTPGYDRCNYPEVLFINDLPLRHVASLSQVTAGAFFFDYNADKVYFVDDPNGRNVELSVTSVAFSGNASNVVIRNLTIEKYAGTGQLGAVRGINSTGWRLINNVVRLNQGIGINIGQRMQVLNNRILSNGQMGLSGIGTDVLVEGNEIAHNNFAQFLAGWEAGGTKFVRTDRLIVRNNFVHRNGGPGLWTDIDNVNVTFENNLVTYNAEAGIFHEISFAAVIRNNVVMFNSPASTPWLYGAQILISSSSGAEVYGNRVVVSSTGGNGITLIQQARGSGPLGAYVTQNNTVRDNTIAYMDAIGQTGAASDSSNSQSIFSANNRFDGNRYFVNNTSYRHWGWANSQRTWDDFRRLGQEANGSRTVGVPADISAIPAWQPPPLQDSSIPPVVTATAVTQTPTSTVATSTVMPTPTVAATPTPAQVAPYFGAPLPVPGRIQVEDFDRGPAGTAYNDLTPQQEGGVHYRTDEHGVDLKPNANGSFTIGWFTQGEWTAYTLNVLQAGQYDIVIAAGSVYENQTFHLEVNGANITGAIIAPTIPNWDTLGSVTVSRVNLSSGIQTIRLVNDSGWLDVDYIDFVAASLPTTATAIVPTATAIVPTATAIVPTATAIVPTATAIVPTATAIVPTATAIVPTATPLPANQTLLAGNTGTGSAAPGALLTVDISLQNTQLMPGGGIDALEVSCALTPLGILAPVSVTGGVLFAPDPVVINSGFRADGTLLYAISQNGSAPIVTSSGSVLQLSFNALTVGSAEINCNAVALDGNRQLTSLPALRLPVVVSLDPTTDPVIPTATIVASPTSMPEMTATPLPPSPTPLVPTATLVPTLSPTPDVTATATNTPQPQLGSVSGNIQRSVGAHDGIIVRLLDGTGAVIGSAITDERGAFLIENVVPNPYVIVADAPGYLSASGVVLVNAGTVAQMANVVLLAGDVFESDPQTIDELDVVQLAINYGQAAPPGDINADLNVDGRVNLPDLAALADNIRATGPTEWLSTSGF
jgi:hypothetical protein